MLDSCHKHPHEIGVDLCRRCGGSWCSSCLVYAFGPKKPPYCMGCAMVAGGVRTAASVPAMPRRELKAHMRAMKAQAKADAKAQAEAAAQPAEPEVSPEVERELAEAYSQTDWATPWWEDRQPTLAD